MKKNIESILENFRDFLISSWNNIERLEGFNEDSDFISDLLNDFLQSNWEILVESLICEPGEEFLEVYGDGADCNGASSRICFPDKAATHRIECIGKSSLQVIDKLNGVRIKPEDCIFHSFVTYSKGKYYQGIPFNGILLEHEKGISVVDINDIFFRKSKILEHI